MKILADTNFILTCIKQKIDFFSLADETFTEKVDWLIPEEVLSELENISKRDGEKTKDKDSAKLALKIIFRINPERVKLNNTVDEGIIEYAKDKDIVIATLDKELRSKLQNKILYIRSRKKLELI